MGELLNRQLQRGDRVRKTGGDYRFEGVIVSVFQKRTDNERSGLLRCVVENDDGMLFIFAPSQLELVPND